MITEQDIKRIVSPFYLRDHITQVSLEEYTELLTTATVLEKRGTQQHHVNRFLEFFSSVLPFMFLKKTTMYYDSVHKAIEIISKHYNISLVQKKEGEFTENLRVQVTKLS
jgi:hypothetical protein